MLEGTGAEAVVPLEHNKAWLSKVAEDLNEIQMSNAYSSDPNAFNALENALERVIALLEELRDKKIYLDSGVMVGELIPAIDVRLSDRFRHSTRGNTR